MREGDGGGEVALGVFCRVYKRLSTGSIGGKCYVFQLLSGRSRLRDPDDMRGEKRTDPTPLLLETRSFHDIQCLTLAHPPTSIASKVPQPTTNPDRLKERNVKLNECTRNAILI